MSAPGPGATPFRARYPPAMCGRYALFGPYSRHDPAWVAAWMEQLVTATHGESRYNIAPSQEVPVFVTGADGASVRLMRWGLVPSWARDTKIAYSTINARVETVAEKPAFRGAWRARRRALVPATGWYEWKAVGTLKQPYYVSASDGNPQMLGALWERWLDPQGVELHSCAIITVPVRPELAAVHDRMPLVLAPAQWTGWLDPKLPQVPAVLEAAAVPYTFTTVARTVNSVRNDGPELVRPLFG
jgi:putative SOS response-associated peptidase YedK